jgi:hypothetical protein
MPNGDNGDKSSLKNSALNRRNILVRRPSHFAAARYSVAFGVEVDIARPLPIGRS